MQLEAHMLTLIEVCGLGDSSGPWTRSRAAQLQAAVAPGSVRRHSSPSVTRSSRERTGQWPLLQRFMIAAASTVMFIFLLAICLIEGALSAAPFAAASLSPLSAIAGLYFVSRSGLNMRPHDRSLTVPIMLCATCAVTFVLYYVGPARPVFLLMYPVILFFGVFRLTTRTLLGVAAVALAGYASIIVMLLLSAPGIARPHIEILQWVVLATVLIWFSFMGGYVNHLHSRLKESEYDALTGIYTRRRILEVLEHEKIRCDRGAGPLCIGMLDIDRFKQVNDNFGHAVGDEVLRRSVAIGQKELRTIDFMGRYGGEEFLMVLPQTELEGARECAERVRSETQRCGFDVCGEKHNMTLSIGLAQYRPGEPVSELLERADAALYRAKTAGRNRVECERRV
jgi:diguanylate cyclase (GGDEF)-like protein